MYYGWRYSVQAGAHARTGVRFAGARVKLPMILSIPERVPKTSGRRSFNGCWAPVIEMQKEKRKMPRQSGRLQQAQIITPAREPFTCRVSDLSETGARLSLHDSAALPDFFTLRLAAPERERECRVVWRSRNLIGVKFERKQLGLRRTG